MYLNRAWYVAAWDHEITRAPLSRTLLGRPVVFWRTGDGRAVALEDRCRHRHAPLSAGTVVGDTIQCGYHGLMFDRAGQCIKVPSQTRIPPGARVRAYPLVEKNRWVWIWMGEAEMADESLIPDVYWHDSPDWAALGDRFHVKCNHQALIDIQLDNTHSSFVHPTTLGNAGSLRHDPKVERDGERLHNGRRMRDSDPPPLLARAARFEGNGDVWVTWTYHPRAGLITFDTGIAPPGSGVFEGDRSQAFNVFNTHGITPETESTCHHFWMSARDFALQDETATETLAEIRDTFLEDVAMVEAQQRSIAIDPDAPSIDVNADQPTIQARNLMDRLIRMQTGPEAAAETGAS